MPLLPLPNIPMTSMSREFLIDDVKMEITSVDIASHGGFIIVGCSNGILLFFDITESHSQRNGTFLAHIRPKGMHTSFKLNVKITEDCRLCFAGVLKGSSEMLAIDLSAYQLNWNKNNSSSLQKTNGKNKLSSSSFDGSCIANFLLFSYSDAKLRGFGAATCINRPDSSRSEPVLVSSEEVKPENNGNGEESLSNAVVPVAPSSPAFRKYLLACGMGIKNVHVWQVIIYDTLTIEEMAANPLRKKRDEWACIYDVATNGMSITHLGFRNEGRELLTKSSSMNLRVWDLANYHNQQLQKQNENGKKETSASAITATPPAKPSYEDIVNTFDVKCLIENSTFTYGGTYEFATINVEKNIPKEANRNVLELPFDASVETNATSTVTAAANERRRRAMREVSDVISTQDGKYALILCSDGGIIYYKHPNKNEDTEEPEPENEDSDGEREAKVDEYDERSSNEENKSPISHNHKEKENNNDHLPQLSELSSISKDIDNQFWSLKRIGKQGLVLLIRAFTRYEKERKNEILPAGTIPPMTNGTPAKNGVSVISLVTLYDLLNTKEGRASFLSMSESRKGKKGTITTLPWHRLGMFYQEDPSFFLNVSPSMSCTASMDEGEYDDESRNRTPSMQVERCSTPLPFLSKNTIDKDDTDADGKTGGIALDTPKTGFERVASSGSLVKLPKATSKLPPTTGKKRKLGGMYSDCYFSALSHPALAVSFC
jgi:hypothetical protein